MGEYDLRSVRVLVMGAGDTVLVDERGELPQELVALHAGETTIAAVRRTLLPTVGHPGPILDCYIVQPPDDSDPAEPIAVLVELDRPPDSWIPPPPLEWAPVERTMLEVDHGLQALLTETIAVRRGLGAPDPLRPAWTEPGWVERASRWIESTLEAAGRGQPTEIAQFRHWGISALMQVETPTGRAWFKAVFPHFRHEAALTAMLDRLMPGSVAGVVGFDADQGWLLVEHVEPDRHGDADPREHADAVAALVALQRRFVDEGTGALIEAGCAVRPLGQLPDDFARAVADPVVADHVDLTPERVATMVDWLSRAVAAIDAVGVPDTLVHGDFHPNNVIVSSGQHVIIDWSDGAVSHPLLDVAAWASWLRGQPDEIAVLWESFYAAWADAPWLQPMRALQSTFDGVAAAYHFVSYVGIVAALDPHRRPEHAGGLAGFFRIVDDAASRSDAEPA
jgi:hypothetical protein